MRDKEARDEPCDDTSIRLERAGTGAAHLTEAAVRLVIRALFHAYAHRADTRDAEGQKALFAVDTRFAAVYMDGPGSEPSYVIERREALSRSWRT
jgi:hypothetical protein